MKTLLFITIATFTILGLLTYLYVEHATQTANSRITKAQLERVMLERDSLETIYKLRGDSLQIAFETIRQANKATAKAHEETKAYRKKFESVVFVKYTSDSARNEVLKKLYKSYAP